MNRADTSADRTLWTARSASASPEWTGLHDQVMGGRSTGDALLQAGNGSEPDHIRFTGQVSRDNGGGFASFRLRLASPAAIYETRAVAITLRGDSGPFKLCLHRQADWDGVQWQAELASSSTWARQTLPLSAFVARQRGREVRASPLSAGDTLFQLGLMSSRAQAGPYWLEVARIALR